MYVKVGFMTKNCLSTFDPVISLRNGKTDQSVRVTVREPIPKPLDDKIKVIFSYSYRSSLIFSALI